MAGEHLRLAPTLAERLRRDRLVTIARNAVLAQTAAECVTTFAAAGIPTIVLKGLAYQARLYADPGVRPCGDIDLLVPMTARRLAFEVLDRLGFEPRAAAPGFDDSDYHEVAWKRGPVEVDLHLALAPLVRCSVDYEEVWADAQPLDLEGVAGRMLAPPHAATFHALHMAIDHFDVPAINLVDFARLVPTRREAEEAAATARRWRCYRPFETTMALCAAFLPLWSSRQATTVPSRRVRRIVSDYGTMDRLPRWRQLVRKVTHFDSGFDLARYAVVQGRRKLREALESRRPRSARERLGIGT
jgi:hypothetical protein